MLTCIRTALIVSLLGTLTACDDASVTAPSPVSVTDVPVTPAPVSPGMVWVDEFEGGSIDTSSWNVENSNSVSYGGTDQAWRAANVVVSNGQLHLLSRRESAGGRAYTSGAVSTRGKRVFRVPFRVEVRARIPRGQGIWPAIWTREGQTNTAVTQEIDIMESVGDPRVVTMTNHTWMPHVQHESCTATGVDMSADMHVYAIEVTAEKMTWFIDGVERCSSTQGIPVDSSHLLINTSIGGDWPGHPDGSTPFPQSFDVDFVRFSVP